ncbi:hypothetical protein ESCOMMO157M_22210 [Escherichia coli]
MLGVIFPSQKKGAFSPFLYNLTFLPRLMNGLSINA